MINDYISKQRQILEKIRRILVDSIEEDYVSIELHEELFESSDRCVMFYTDKLGNRKNIVLKAIENLDIMELSFDLNKIMDQENGKSWKSFSLSYRRGGSVGVNFNYK